MRGLAEGPVSSRPRGNCSLAKETDHHLYRLPSYSIQNPAQLQHPRVRSSSAEGITDLRESR